MKIDQELKFPKRRALGLLETYEILRLMIEAIITGDDPSYEGKIQEKFKQSFLAWYGNKKGYVELVSSGTNAIYCALLALDLPKDSIVHVSPITDPGSVSAIINAGYRVNVLDTDSEISGQTSLDSLQVNLTSESSAVLLVHHAGWPGKSLEFASFCKKNSLKLVEDVSQSLGSISNNQYTGLYGDIAVASTMYRKVLTTGSSGGILYTHNYEYYKRICLFKDRGKPIWKKTFSNDFQAARDGNNIILPALNNNQDDLNIAWGIGSLHRLPRVIEKRKIPTMIL